MTLPPVLTSTRARLVAVVVVGVTLFMLVRALTPPAVRAPGHVASHARQDSGYWFDLAARVRSGAADDPRLGLTVAAAYGDPARPLPALGVLAGVIKFGHGDEIVNGIAGGLSAGGLTLGPRTAAPAGKHGGTFECGLTTGVGAGTYCVWWNDSVVGIAVVPGLDPTAARALALQARNATQR